MHAIWLCLYSAARSDRRWRRGGVVGAFFVHIRGFLLAAMISSGSCLILLHGLANTGPIVTGLFIIASTLALMLVSRWT